MATESAATVQQAKETLDRECSASPSVQPYALSLTLLPPPPPRAVAFEVSRLLDTGLDKETLSILIALVESGVNPEALANVVKELRREAAELKAAQAAAGTLPPGLATQASEGEPSQSTLIL